MIVHCHMENPYKPSKAAQFLTTKLHLFISLIFFFFDKVKKKKGCKLRFP